MLSSGRDLCGDRGDGAGCSVVGPHPAVRVHHPYSGFPGGLKSQSYQELLAKNPAKAVEKAVRGMLPKTTLGRAQLTKLKVYSGAEHPHAAQKPQPFEISQVAQ